ncbi:MAG: type IV secretory system conjugative DNA transfer family protein [Elainellaceae cyanobacterium]
MNQNDIRALMEDIEAGRITPEEYFKQQAVNHTAEKHFGMKLEAIAVVGGSVAGFAMFGTLGAAGLALIAAQLMWTKWRKGNEAIAAIEAGDVAAHLPKKEVKSYAKVLAAAQQQPAPTAAPTAPQTAAIPVRAEAVPSASGLSRIQEVVNTQPASAAAYNVAEDLAANTQNTLIIGKPGSGKGMLLANALRGVQRRSPNTRLFVIDPKGDQREQGYWTQGATVRAEQALEWEPAILARWLHDCMDEFASLPAPKLLVVDECKHLSSMLKTVDDRGKAFNRFWQRIEAFTSYGDAQGNHVWVISQVAHASDLNISGGTRSLFRAIALVSGEDLGYVDSLTATQIVSKPDGGNALVKELAKQSEVNRAFYDGKHMDWFPMPRLENYSDFDRDTRTVLRQQPTTKDRLEAAYEAAPTVATLTPKAPNLFADAIAKVRQNDGGILDLLEVEANAIERLIGWLYDNKRGQVVTTKDVADNKANRAEGISSKAAAADAMALLEMMGLCRANETDGEYFVIS